MTLRRLLSVAAAVGVAAALSSAAARAGLGPAQTAKRAAQQLGAASVALQKADGARDRVKALTQTVKAYEEGLRAMRQGLRLAAIRERAIQLEFDAKSTELSRLVAALESMGSAPSPVLLLHPSGPLGTARAGMILAEVSPALQEQADALRARLQEMALLRSLQQGATDTLQQGLAGVQQARTQLSQAISRRTKLPRRFVEDPVKTAILLESSKTLGAFAAGLAQTDEGAGNADLPDFESARGKLPLPVAGTVLRRYNEADAAGIRRPGLLLATRPLAIVTTPVAATIRYRGPLLYYGNVMVLEPGEGYLLVLAGLSQVYGEIGEVLDAGAPVGLMGGANPDISEFLSVSGEGAGTERTETLYIELRKGQKPVNPADWFTMNKE